MATTTENLGLVLPEEQEYFELDTWTGNCRKLDAGYGTTLQTIANNVAAAMHQYAEEGGTIHDIDTGFVTTLKEINHGLPFRVWLGTTAEFAYLKTNDLLEDNTWYIRTDDKTASFPGSIDPTIPIESLAGTADNLLIYSLTGIPDTTIYPTAADSALVAMFGSGSARTFIFSTATAAYIKTMVSTEQGALSGAWLPLTADTGWKTLEISGTGFSAGSQTPQYRKIGSCVYVRGQIVVDMDQVPDLTTVFATLPSGYRPSAAKYQLLAGEGDRMARLYVRTGGGININYFKEYAGSTVTGSHWLQLDCSFLTD